MQTVYIGNTLVNDIMLGAQRMDDVVQPKPTYIIEYLVVAGGAGGSNARSGRAGGGGGAGGLLSGSATILPGVTYQVKVGGGSADPGTGTNGDTSFLTGSNFYFVATGGGAGNSGGDNNPGSNGGSGGGGGQRSTTGTNAGGTGISGQGNNGGTGTTSLPGAGGGADTAASGNTPGTGKSSAISGTLTTYATGGAGAAGGNGLNGSGNGGGGQNGPQTNQFGIGGNGIVIIRYFGSQKGTGGTVTTDGNFTIHTFTSATSQTSATFTYVG